MPVFTPQLHSVTALLAGTHFPSHWGQEVELAWVAWWNTYVVCLTKMITHLST